MKKVSLLSTKILSSTQHLLLKKNGFVVNDYNAITITPFPLKGNKSHKNIIITSQNAAKILIQNSVKADNIFCVGEKTKSLLISNNYNVKEVSVNAISLGKVIVKKYKDFSFVFLCGNLRRNELPELLNKEKITFFEEIIYKTSLNFLEFDNDFDAVLFFSPSGVKSYIENNNLSNSLVFCIGNTTKKIADKYALKTLTANTTTVDATINRLIDYFKA